MPTGLGFLPGGAPLRGCFNPEAAEREAAVRARMIAQLDEAITDSDQCQLPSCA